MRFRRYIICIIACLSLSLAFVSSASALTLEQCVKVEETKQSHSEAVTYCEAHGDSPFKESVKVDADFIGNDGLGIVIVLFTALVLLIACAILLPWAFETARRIL